MNKRTVYLIMWGLHRLVGGKLTFGQYVRRDYWGTPGPPE